MYALLESSTAEDGRLKPDPFIIHVSMYAFVTDSPLISSQGGNP
jgi:hypothetical protein